MPIFLREPAKVLQLHRARLCRFKNETNKSVAEMPVRRLFKSHGIDVFDIVANAQDEIVPREKRPMVGTYAKGGKQRSWQIEFVSTG